MESPSNLRLLRAQFTLEARSSHWQRFWCDLTRPGDGRLGFLIIDAWRNGRRWLGGGLAQGKNCSGAIPAIIDARFLVTVNGSTSGSDGLTPEFTGPRRWAKPAVIGPVQRRVGRHPWAMSRPVIFHERGNLHELDARAHTVKTGHPLE